jgi:hypothetical protein
MNLRNAQVVFGVLTLTLRGPHTFDIKWVDHAFFIAALLFIPDSAECYPFYSIL